MTKQSKKIKTVLVIEDEVAMLQILIDGFTFEGFNVIEAKNGKDGLRRALKEHPDLILLDLILPKMDGMTMLEKLRTDNWGRDVPVIILSNLSNTEIIAQALENGTYGFLVKADWKLEDLVEKVKERLRLK